MSRVRRLLPRGLFARSLLIVLIPLVALQAVSAFIFYDRHWNDVGRRLARSLAGDVSMLAEAVENPGIESQWLLERAPDHFGMDAHFEPGERLSEPTPERVSGSIDRMVAAVFPEMLEYPFRFDSRSAPGRVEIAVELPSGVLQVSTSRKRLFSSTTYIFILWMCGTSVVLFAIAVYFLRRQVAPIRRLAQAAENFGKGLPSPDIKLQGAREVRQAARAFLLMRERIQRHVTQRTDMLAGVSHDLRTPLTRMKLQLAMLGNDDAVDELAADVSDMERMIEAYLAFARGEGEEEAADTDFDLLLESVMASARRRGDSLALDNRAPGLRLTLRADAIRRALTNLIDNAIRHGRAAIVTVVQRGRNVVLTVDDDGPGIPPAGREKVFRPFVRLDEARASDGGGSGLGLTIARDAVRNHGGDITLGDSPQGGLRAQITLPL